MTSEKLSGLNIKRGTLKRKLTMAQNVINELKSSKESPACLAKVQECLTRTGSIYDEFFDIQGEIEELETVLKLASTADQCNTFHKEFYSVMCELKALEAKYSAKSAKKSDISRVQNSAVNVKLPELTLPSFDGSYTEWTSFHDTFSALVDENNDLSEIHKFHYLKSCLKGKAIKIIESLKVTSENYEPAWNLLKNRYSNPRLIVQDHIFGILNNSNINKPSHEELRKLLDSVNSHLEALTVHNVDHAKFRDIMLVSIISEKLDFVSKREWQGKLSSELPTWEDLKQFLEKRCETLETLHLMSNKSNNNCQETHSKKGNIRVAAISTNKNKKAKFNTNSNRSVMCPYCSDPHYLFHCAKFINLMVTDRLRIVRSKKLCSNCFQNSHTVAECKSSYVCKICKGHHNALLHVDNPEPNEIPSTSSENNQVESDQSVVLKVNSRQVYFSKVVLPTAQVQIYDKSGNKHQVRALLDSGSELNFISERMSKLLNLKSQPIVLSIAGVNRCNTSASQLASIKIHSNYRHYDLNLSCVILPQISEFLPSTSFSIANLEFPHHIKLADPAFHVKGTIDLLLGAQAFFEILEPNRRCLNKDFILQETKFGWVVVNAHGDNPGVVKQGSCYYTQPVLEQMVGKFWELDEFKTSAKPQSADEILCEKKFMEGHKRLEMGRYSVPLPFKAENPNLGTSREGAIKRFKSLECKFRKDENFKLSYSAVITDYLQQGHAEQVPEDEIDNPGSYYLPHHGVLKESTTTQLRIVFDASFRSSNHKSLNDELLVGPKIHSDLYPILLRFREHIVAFTADISQMYRQIGVHPEYHDYQRLVWRFDENLPIQTYRLKTVTFGITSAPFLAIRTLHQLANDERKTYPNAHHHIINNMYVDDLISGSDTLENAVKLKTEITDCLLRGCFQLRKWASNNKALLPENICSSSEINLDKEGISKTLGIIWDCKSDNIRYRINLKDTYSTISKRTVLSIIAQLFDPLGLIAPVIVTAKIILQQLWIAKLGWDEGLPDHLECQWINFMQTLSDLNDIVIPRCVLSGQVPVRTELHGFCDSSQLAYGACIFIKTIQKTGDIKVHLLTAKSRVAPIKTQTLPRLELCGAVLLAELTAQVRASLRCNISGEFYYTDSTIVLSWLAATPSTWTTFVANRVSKIQSLTRVENWNHVSSSSNPADILSRGCSPKQLIDNQLWFNGPMLLREKVAHSTDLKVLINNFEVEERRQAVCSKAVVHNKDQSPSDLLLRYSSFSKLINVVAFCLRFYNRVRYRQGVNGALTVKEIENSRNVIIKMVQQESFPEEFKCLIKGNALPKSSPLIKLNPFLDDNLLIRVGGRLVNANILFDKKFPLVIPKLHHITKLIVLQTHLRQLHAGPQATLAVIRQTYWPIGGRDIIRKILHECVLCRRSKPIPYEEIMGNLPEDRVNLVRPFLNCGVDYAGPILIREGRGRGKKSIKAYICLFVCFATKAVHLELVTDCTSLAFIGAFKRFMSRRGKPSNIYSDNATNFKGANRELRVIHFDVIKSDAFRKFINDCAGNNVNWRFIPPRSPHVGGIWEAGIKSMKYHLKRVIGQSLFTYEEMYTYLTLIEACLNSRPITPLSSNPDDLSALTPGHFLIGTALTSPAEPDVSDINIHRLGQWEKIQQLRQHFWKRWSREYLVELQQRSKWATSVRSATVGDIVIVHEDNVPPLCWCLGRVEIIHPGRDEKSSPTTKAKRATRKREHLVTLKIPFAPGAICSHQTYEDPPTKTHKLNASYVRPNSRTHYEKLKAR
ncbi:uncharacterized protein LOC135125701 [Zophobas morio]|uniref:uncharacterized protein LOC135125701 n=1 Tax=Zophobas morio TaxID=2755281 RepID=UPI0030838DC8